MHRSNPRLCGTGPVVADVPSRDDADRSLEALRRAGYAQDMLQVIGTRGEGEDVARLLERERSTAASPSTCGLLLGAVWASFAFAATLAPPVAHGRFAMLVSFGAAALVLQALVLARAVRGSACRSAGSPAFGAHRPDGRADSSPWRFLVVVHGSRSDVALARDILAH